MRRGPRVAAIALASAALFFLGLGATIMVQAIVAEGSQARQALGVFIAGVWLIGCLLLATVLALAGRLAWRASKRPPPAP